MTASNASNASNASALFTLSSNGLVGIKNAMPSFTLDVAGDINFTGTVFQNGQPTSQATNGNATYSNISSLTASINTLNGSNVVFSNAYATSLQSVDVASLKGTFSNITINNAVVNTVTWRGCQSYRRQVT